MSAYHCECGRKYPLVNDDSVLNNADDHPKYCNVCDDEFMGYVLESVDNGVIHDALFEIFLPHACLMCNKRHTTPGPLQEHLNVCILVQVDAEGARSKFWGVAGSEDLACATLPTTPFDFQGKITNFCHPSLIKITFKITVTPPPKKKHDKVKITVLQ